MRGCIALHEAGWVHGDIKPAQVMIMKQEGRWKAKLCDLDWMRRKGAELGGYTPLYGEVAYYGYTGEPLAEATDVFCFGTSLIDMIFKGKVMESWAAQHFDIQHPVQRSQYAFLENGLVSSRGLEDFKKAEIRRQALENDGLWELLIHFFCDTPELKKRMEEIGKKWWKDIRCLPTWVHRSRLAHIQKAKRKKTSLEEHGDALGVWILDDLRSQSAVQIPPEVRNLIIRMLHADPVKRPPLSEAIAVLETWIPETALDVVE